MSKPSEVTEVKDFYTHVYDSSTRLCVIKSLVGSVIVWRTFYDLRARATCAVTRSRATVNSTGNTVMQVTDRGHETEKTLYELESSENIAHSFPFIRITFVEFPSNIIIEPLSSIIG